ncbi:hypothetical protein IscW_ISCW010012 [Ixodes scapularis]|uniref:Uncharacterized protein n=1 Tax=Ixodes scapularis TaxID=6945 RepID=B7Q3B2_IXOSC|nr:hypothetical protein IscW_ISCW010012 [Ixodes scapularis]|eukprot:XP_002411210.1 hypothetical protein IscW_ISCW010012 [Ixodes scapularis]
MRRHTIPNTLAGEQSAQAVAAHSSATLQNRRAIASSTPPPPRRCSGLRDDHGRNARRIQEQAVCMNAAGRGSKTSEELEKLGACVRV